MDRLAYDNIFESITDDPAEAADLAFRADLVSTMVDLIEDNGWSPSQVAGILDVPQPRVSELMRGKIHLFSSDKLIGYAAKLGVRFKPSYADHKVICEVFIAG
ncbi:helix-turn-helix transcriptional regulator [Rhizobium sp. FY34]|uniref:helix-turn-helix domain-containing protein n=1 Tax=Rhizobium sp. FY34 TaxID=2562309 RepID=UPI0010C0C12E|nr:helix-turn-helix transcriptional regulator [Rhizobium sp. FY34]